MTRVPLSVLGGAALALALFWLLALLVAPPQADIERLEPARLSLVEAEAPAEQAMAEAASTAVAPPPPAPVTPPPMPEPAALAESHLTLPEPELPAQESPPVALDESLPELAEQPPESSPEPEPQARPQPKTEPQPTQAPTGPEASPSSERAVAAASSVASEASSEAVDVGALTPTNRVPPVYPVRAQRRGQEGFVEVRFLIRPDGRVAPDSIEVVAARPRNVFDKAARRAVARWQFESANGLRRARQRLEFQLR